MEVCCVVKSHAVKSWSKIVLALHAAGVQSQEMLVKQPHEIPAGLMAAFYAEHEGRPYYERLVRSVSGPLVFIAARTKDLPAARLAIGPTDPEQARESMPESIRAVFGTELPHNAVHLSDGAESAARELALLRKHGMLSKGPTVGLEPRTTNAEEEDEVQLPPLE